MIKVVVGKQVRLVPERVARIVLALLSSAERIGLTESGRMTINWRGQSVQAEVSSCVEVPSLPE